MPSNNPASGAGSRHVVRAYGLSIASDLPLPGLEPGPEAAGADVTIVLAEAIPELGDAPGKEDWFQVTPEALRLSIEGVGTYLVEEGRRISVAPFPGADPDEVRIFLLGSALGALLMQRSLFPLHGSAVATKHGAMVFCGPSGIGKSTLAAHFHKAGYQLLSDDVCAIGRSTAGGLQVLPAFPHLRLKPDAAERIIGPGSEGAPTRIDVDKFVLPLGEAHAPEPVPLAAVYELRDAEGTEFSLHRLAGFEAIRAIADNLYRPHFLEGMRTRGEVLRLAGDIVAGADVQILSRPRDADRLDALVEWLEDGWSGRDRPAKS